MATSQAKVQRRVEAEQRIAAAQERIVAVLSVDMVTPTEGRIIDPEMRIIRQQENLAYWLELVAGAVEKNNIARLQAENEASEAQAALNALASGNTKQTPEQEPEKPASQKKA